MMRSKYSLGCARSLSITSPLRSEYEFCLFLDFFGMNCPAYKSLTPTIELRWSRALCNQELASTRFGFSVHYGIEHIGKFDEFGLIFIYF